MDSGREANDSSESSKSVVVGERKRPIGIVLLAVVHLAGGLLLAVQRISVLTNIYANAEGAVTLSTAYKVALLGEGLIVVVAIVSAIAMFFGVKFGWWLGCFYWTWRISREVCIPLLGILFKWLSGFADNEIPIPVSKLSLSALLQGLIIVYFFRERVLRFFRMESLNKLLAAIVLLGGGFLIAFIFDVLKAIPQPIMQ